MIAYRNIVRFTSHVPMPPAYTPGITQAIRARIAAVNAAAVRKPLADWQRGPACWFCRHPFTAGDRLRKYHGSGGRAVA